MIQDCASQYLVVTKQKAGCGRVGGSWSVNWKRGGGLYGIDMRGDGGMRDEAFR